MAASLSGRGDQSGLQMQTGSSLVDTSLDFAEMKGPLLASIGFFLLFALFFYTFGPEEEKNFPFPEGIVLDELQPLHVIEPTGVDLVLPNPEPNLQKRASCSFYGCEVDKRIHQNISSINELKHALKWEEAKKKLDELEAMYNNSAAVMEAVGGYTQHTHTATQTIFISHILRLTQAIIMTKKNGQSVHPTGSEHLT